MSEEQEARKMSQYELELKLDRMTQRAFPSTIQKAPKKPLSEVDVEIIKEYQKQFNEPIKEYQFDIDPESGEQTVRLLPDGTPDFKVKAKKFRVVPPPELDVVDQNEFYTIPTDEEKAQTYEELNKIKEFIEIANASLKTMDKEKKFIKDIIDALPTPNKYVEIPNATRPTGIKGIVEVSTRLRNYDYDKQQQAVDDERKRMLERLTSIVRQEKRINEDVQEATDIYNNLTSEYQKIETYKSMNDAEVAKVKKINSERVKEYQNTLNLMNRGAFQQDQMPNETEEDYVARLQANAEEEVITETKFEAELDIKRKFKEALKKLIRDDVKIEQVANSIRDDEMEIKTEILKKFPLFRKKFLDIYGLNNPVVSKTDILTFIDAFIKSSKGDIGMLNLLQEEPARREETRTVVEIAEQDKKKVYIVENPANPSKKVYFRLGEDFDTNQLFLLYSISGKRGTYKEFLPTDEDLTPMDLDQDRENSFVEIRRATGITAKLLNSNFGDKPYRSAVRQSKNPLKFNPSLGLNWIDWLSKRIETTTNFDQIGANYEKPYEYDGRDYPATMGWGLKQEEVPDMVQFGKIKLALNKLFYKNILSARHNNLGRIAGFQNVKVSDDFVAIIMKLSKGEKVLKQEVDALQKSEQILYDNLLSLANLHKRAPNNRDATITSLKERMDLIGGEIDAGNDNRALVKELYNIVHGLKNFGVITNKEATKYLSQF